MGFSATDRRTLERGGELRQALAACLAPGGAPGPERQVWFHPAGGCAMAADEASGVVDRDCRVFGLDNLWLAGAAVFPTSGSSNPTLTIVALALRLADHLAAGLGSA
jgi:choline dehydrogenase-like flavoprotein